MPIALHLLFVLNMLLLTETERCYHPSNAEQTASVLAV